MSNLPPLEIRALARIMDELDYYQMLHLERSATGSEVRAAFYASSRVFHPDANRHLGPEASADCTAISKRVTEGYCVLRDPRKRLAYDSKLAESGGTRMQLAEAEAAKKRDSGSAQAKTPQGRQFHKRALAAIAKCDWAAAKNHLQMALTFEPQNASLKEQLDEIRVELEAARKSKKSA